MRSTAKDIALRLYAAWLTFRLGAYSRQLQTIAAQRENDLHAERFLHEQISSAHAELRSLVCSQVHISK